MAKAKVLKFDAAGPGLSKSEILKVCEAENVRFMRLQFTDIFGVIRCMISANTPRRVAMRCGRRMIASAIRSAACSGVMMVGISS